MTREVLREIARHPVDITYLDVYVIQGVVHIGGKLQKLRGYYEDLDLEEELKGIIRLLRLRPGVTDVCCEVELGEPSLRERMSPHPRRVRY